MVFIKLKMKTLPAKSLSFLQVPVMLILLQGAGSTQLLQAQSMAWGDYLFTVPEGWTTSENAQFMELFPLRAAEQEIFSILLLKGRTGGSSLENELALAWDEFAGMLGAEKLFEVNGMNYTMDEVRRTAAGWEYLAGHGSIRSNGDFFVHAYIIRAGEKTERVFVLAKEIRLDAVRNNIDPTVHHQPYYDIITSFIFNLRFAGFESIPLPAASASGALPCGVWAGIGFMGGQLESTYAVFFSNGQVYYGSRFPLSGLSGLDTYADRERIPRYWGTWEYANGAGQMHLPSGSFPFRIEGSSLVMDPYGTEHRFIRVPPVDDIRLQGSYMLEDEYGRSCTLIFRSDGTFTDNGVLRILDHSLYQYYSIADGGGSGSYRAKDHTLLFHFSDGRELKVAFPGAGLSHADPSPAELILSFNEDRLVRK